MKTERWSTTQRPRSNGRKSMKNERKGLINNGRSRISEREKENVQ